MAFSSSTPDLVKRLTQLLNQIPTADQEAIFNASISGPKEEKQSVLATGVDGATTKVEHIAPITQKGKVTSLNEEEGQGNQASVVARSDTEDESEGVTEKDPGFAQILKPRILVKGNPSKIGKKRKKTGNLDDTLVQYTGGSPAFRTRSAAAAHSCSFETIRPWYRPKAKAKETLVTETTTGDKESLTKEGCENREEKAEGSRKGKKADSGNEGLKPGIPAKRVMTMRKVIPDLLLDESIFKVIPGTFLEWMNECQGWEHLFKNSVEADEDQVKEFYSQLCIDSNDKSAKAKLVVKGVEWEFCDKEVGKILNIPKGGIGVFPKDSWPNDKEEILKILFDDPNKKVEGLLNTGMSAAVKAIHQVVVRGLTPRLEETSTVSVHDAYLMASVLKREKIDLAVTMMKHMQSCARSKTRGLPYPGLVKSLLIKAELYNAVKEVPLVHSFDVASSEKVNCETKKLSVEEKIDRLSERMDELHSKYDKSMSWLEKLAAESSTKQNEATISETSSDDTSADQNEERRV